MCSCSCLCSGLVCSVLSVLLYVPVSWGALYVVLGLTRVILVGGSKATRMCEARLMMDRAGWLAGSRWGDGDGRARDTYTCSLDRA